MQKRQPEPSKRYMSLALALAHPLSRGSVHATSSDPTVQPAIDLRALEHPADLDLLVDAVKWSRKVFQTAPLKDTVKTEAAPGPGFETDEQIKEWVKDSLWNVFHPVGTASMLPLEDGGVVDPELKVYGAENLRVVSGFNVPLTIRSLMRYVYQVDASVMPVQIAAHIQMTIYAIAEKVST
jgi:choline dehydrogenase-like flavoprotein